MSGLDVDSSIIFACDLDGTGSMHICSEEDPGAVRYVDADAQAALIAELVEALQEVRDLIAGDLVGSAWKRACREKIAKANAALARAKEAQK